MGSASVDPYAVDEKALIHPPSPSKASIDSFAVGSAALRARARSQAGGIESTDSAKMVVTADMPGLGGVPAPPEVH